jgi:hypothetical protein
VHIGQTWQSVEKRVKGHHSDIYLYHPEISVLAEHSINLGHWIQQQNASTLAKKSRHMDWVIREVIEIDASSQQHKQGRWLLPELDMEASHL